MIDALGNKLIIGNLYGYSRNSNGLTTVKIGTLIKINEKRVSIEVRESHKGFSTKLRNMKIDNKVVSVNPDGLFPVSDFQIDEEVIHADFPNEVFTVTGIRKNEIELYGDWSGGTHHTCERAWTAIELVNKKL